MALGAPPARVLRLVVWEGAVLALTGIALGLAGALMLTSLMSALLYRAAPNDPATFAIVTFAAVSILLALVALGACCLPAWRAMRLNPIVALRYE